MKMGTQVPIHPVKWGPGVPISGGPHFPMTPAARKSHFPRYRAKFATNALFERCMGPLKHTYENQSFIYLDMQLWTPLMSLVVTDSLSCGWPIVGTNSEWVQKNSLRGEPILGRSKLNVTGKNRKRCSGINWIQDTWLEPPVASFPVPAQFSLSA